MSDYSTRQNVTDGAKLTEIIGTPKPDIATKEMTALDTHCRHFISLCPFLCISTANSDGNQDISPRGDPAGFVRVLDDKTILIPDRKGNRRVDTMRNILENPNVGLIMMLPGVEEVLRINGKAKLTEDSSMLRASAVNDSIPAIGIIVKIDDVFFTAPKPSSARNSGIRKRQLSEINSRLMVKSLATNAPPMVMLSPSMPTSNTPIRPTYTSH